MLSKRDVLAHVPRELLVHFLNFYGLSVPEGPRRGEAADMLATAPQADFDDMLSALLRDELKSICRALALEDRGKAKTVLVKRLTDAVTAPTQQVPPPPASTSTSAASQQPFPPRVMSSQATSPLERGNTPLAALTVASSPPRADPRPTPAAAHAQQSNHTLPTDDAPPPRRSPAPPVAAPWFREETAHQRPPPSPEVIAEWAQRFRVPQRIARGELLGGMSCESWRALNPEEAARFHRVYAIFLSVGNITVENAINLERSRVTNESLRTRRLEREAAAFVQEVEEQIRAGRQSVPGTAVDLFRRTLIEQKTRIALVLADRVMIDHLSGVERLSLRLAGVGDVPTLDIVALGPLPAWEGLQQLVRLNESLSTSPMPVPILLSRRRAADPRPFLPLVGERLTLTLRNGLILTLRLDAVGPYDLIAGDEKGHILIPLHALADWAQADGVMGNRTPGD